MDHDIITEHVTAERVVTELSASERVHASLRTRILQGDIRQGRRLVVRELAAEYDTSDLPVREAIRMLQSDGLAVVNKNRGACVISISPEDIPGAYILRGEIEALAIRLAGPSLTEANIAELSQMADRMEMLALQDDTDGYADVNRAFHSLLTSRCPYQVVRRQVEQLWDSKFDFAIIFGIDTRQLVRSSNHHLRLVDALKAGDWAGAATISRARKLEIARSLLLALNQPIPPELYYDDLEESDA